MHLSVVIPVYKAEDCLLELYRRLRASLETITDDFEIILVEDCGGDCSWAIIGELAQADPRVKGIQFSRNFGQHYGITAGLDQCNGDWVVVMDCDLQDQPEEIPKLYAKAQEGVEVVYARRAVRKSVPHFLITAHYCEAGRGSVKWCLIIQWNHVNESIQFYEKANGCKYKINLSRIFSSRSICAMCSPDTVDTRT